MLVRPDRGDLRVIGLYTGRILTGLGLVMLLPALVGFVRGEVDDALGLVIGGCIAITLGQLAEWRLPTRKPLDRGHAMAVVALGWLAAAFIGAIPLYLSGHFASFLDAYFDAMSGFTTTGLAVINDLDHVSDSINLWRHTMQFLGGQGLVLVALSLFGGAAGITGLYVGEAREDILPNVRRSAQFIWRVAVFYGLLGTVALWAAVLHAGMATVDGLLHAVMLFMGAFDTGGFAPTAASLGFYHSPLVEAVASVLMVAGMLSFAMHYQFMQRSRPLRELSSNLETRFLALSILGLVTLVAVGLARFGTYDSAIALFRRGGFHLLSAHTGTGFGTIPNRLFVTDWGALAPAMIVIAMALGGMANSTTGGIKALRIGVLAKAISGDIRRVVLPPDAVVVQTYHASGRRQILREPLIRSAVMITLLYIVLYFAGAFLAMFYGYSLQEAMFESTSAAANVGLSIGIVGPDLETPLKVAYILQMWIGRLEFIAVFAFLGYLYATLRGKL